MKKIFFYLTVFCFSLLHGQAKDENFFDKDGNKHGFWVYYDLGSNAKVFQGEYVHGKKNGFFKSFYKSGNVRHENNFKMNVFHGVQRSYNEKGVLLWLCEYQEGTKHGIEKIFYNNGKLKIQINYSNGKIDGNQKYYDKNGYLLPFTFETIKKVDGKE